MKKPNNKIRGVNYLDSTEMTASTSTYVECPHHTGWFFTVQFWIFEKHMYWCELCKRAIPRKSLKTK